MPVAIAVGAATALIGIMAIFFVLRRKSVDKRSMYSARRSQIEHKVRAARQRTLAGQGRAEKSEEVPASAGASPFAGQAPVAMYEASAYEAPPAAAPPTGRGIPEAPSSSPWDVGPTAPPSEQFAPPPPPPVFEPVPNQEVWTPAPAPEQAPPEPATPIEPARPAIAAASPAAWSVVGEAKESAMTAEVEPKKKKRGKEQETAAPAGSWQLASGNAPGAETEEAEGVIKAPGQAVAIAQYAVLVVGLIAVLIGVLIILAGSPAK